MIPKDPDWCSFHGLGSPYISVSKFQLGLLLFEIIHWVHFLHISMRIFFVELNYCFINLIVAKASSSCVGSRTEIIAGLVRRVAQVGRR
jgi:hypothetical protein